MDDGQWDLDGALTVGPGTDTRVTDVRGLGSPDLRASRTALPRTHGGTAGEDFAGFQTLELELVYVGTPGQVQQRLDLLNRISQPGGDQVWSFVRPGATVRSRFVRAEPLVERILHGGRLLEARLRAVSTDPVTYSPQQTATLSPFVGTAFADYPGDGFDPAGWGDYPKLYLAGGEGGGVVVSNVGTWPTWPRFVISGPSSGAMNVISLENVTTGGIVRFTGDGGLTVPAGSQLIVDMHPARRVVRFAAGASRLNTVVDLSSWWQIVPGQNELRFRADGDTAGASAEAQVRSGWL